MKPLGPWSVKGVDEDARELAKNAAAAADLTLGAWIDRAIKKATGLEPATPHFVPITTSGTTVSKGSSREQGNFNEASDVSTLVETGSSREEGENFEVSAFAGHSSAESMVEQVDDSRVSQSATLGVSESASRLGNGPKGTDLDTTDPRDPTNVTGADEVPVSTVDAGDGDLLDPPTPDDMRVDSDERVAEDVEPRATSRPRRSRSRSRLLQGGVSRFALVTVAVVIVAGAVVYGVGYSGAGDPDPSASAAAIPAPVTSARSDQNETVPPSEPGVIEMLTAAAEQGDAAAQHDLATRYLDGAAVEQDVDRAVRWLKRAASQGMAVAQHRLAVTYQDGTGVAADDNLAAVWHTRAASQGHPASQHALAMAYADGRGVKPSDANAVLWLQRAARAGNVASEVLLAERYEAGRGVERSSEKATEWYASAAAKGHEGAASRARQLAAVTEAETAAIEISTPDVKHAPPADTLLDKAGIAEVQTLLTRLAFKPGPADGVLGGRTIGEIKLYQSFAGLPDNGKATVGLLNELREMVRGMSNQAKPTPDINGH